MVAACESERKCRLRAAAFARQLWGDMDWRCRHAVEVAELLADGLASEAERKAASAATYRAHIDGVEKAGYRPASNHIARLGVLPASAFTGVSDQSPWDAVARARQCGVADAAIAGITADIMGGAASRFEAAWRTPDVAMLALAAYGERLRDFTLCPLRLAVLSDALEEAGCGDEFLLAHLRGPAGHWRGCWALDLALGRD